MTDAVDPVDRPRDEDRAAPVGSTSGGSGRNVAGWILVAIGGLLVVCAIVLAVVHLTQRGADGYYTSDTAKVGSPGYAVTSEGLDIADLPSFATNSIGQVRIRASSRNGRALFVGIASESDVNGYLGGVARNVVTSFNGSTVDSTRHVGGAPAGTPASRTFWQASGSGRGQVSVTWKVKEGNWAVVVMNASATRGVSAGVNLGAKTNLVLWIALGFLVVGAIVAAGGAALLRRRRVSQPL